VRIALGLTALAALSLGLLNVGIYQSALSQQVQQRWKQLATHTDERRDALRDALHRETRQAGHLTGDARVAAWAAAAIDGRLAASDRAELEAELARAARQFDFVAIRLTSPDGRPIASTPGAGPETPGVAGPLTERTLRSRAPEFSDQPRGGGGPPHLLLAMPVVGGAGEEPVAAALFELRVEDVLEPLLHVGQGFGPGANAYLVRAEGQDVVFVTTAPAALGTEPGARVSARDGRFRAAAMAAHGVESNVETRDPRGEDRWAVTRFLPELGWGLVGEAERRALLQTMRGTLIGLLVLDLAMVVLSISAFWFWRRQYLGGLARREMEVTRLHAARVQAVFDTAFDAILTFDGAGHVRSANRAAEALFDRSAADMQGQPVWRYLHPGPFENASVPRSGTVANVEALRPDGTTVPVEFSLGTSGEGEDLLRTVIVRDVSERVEAEKRIHAFAEGLEVSNRRLEEANAQLEEASRLKSEFLANTSHELRTPLNGMIGFLQLVLDDLCDSKEEERDFLKQALQCSRHLLGLINDVLDIAKIEAGKLSLEIERIDVSSLFDEVYTLSHVQASQKGLTLEFVPPDDPTLGVRGDFGKVKQVLINLVGNSLKFTPRGSITVRALPHPDLGYVMFEVADTGVGIPAERQKVIFEKFTQGDGSTTRKYGGTGLGLAISRSLVELMGGIIGVHSQEGKGTRLYFSLPVWRNVPEEEAPTEDSAADRIQGPAGGPLVLIVEDDPTFRLFLSTLLHQHGYRSIEARNAEIGWMLARRLRPAVVVLDFALTSTEGAHLRTGWDLAARMTGDAKTRHIPIVFVTGFDGELREKLRSTEFARQPHHLQKPVETAALIAKIEEVVGNDPNRTLRILMADDDPSVAAYIRKVLPEERFIVETASDGEECLHVLRTQPRGFDLLLLDLMMPKVSGYDVLREMTLHNVAPDLPVLVLTNFPDARNDEERRLLHDGLVIDVVPKVAVHDNPSLLPHIIDWHLQVARETGAPVDDAPEERAA
jgi:PAS domain S-box-containing protein